MKWRKWLSVCIVCVWCVCASPIILAQDVIYDIFKQDVVAEIQANGDVKFTDTQYYNVEFVNGMLFDVEHTGTKLSNYRVGILEEGNSQVQYLTESYSGDPNTYQIDSRENMTTFKVYYPTQDKQVTLIYEYTLQNLVTNYQDTAVFVRKLTGSHTDFWRDVTGTVILPSEVTKKEDFRAWGYGVPDGTVELSVENKKSIVKLNAPNTPANQFVEVMALFPTSMTPNNTNVIEQAKRDAIIEAESARVEEDARQLQKQHAMQQLKNIAIGIIVPIAPLIAGIYYFRKYKSLNPNPIKLPYHIYELPEDITPAIMASAVLRSEPNEADFAATVVDLARKGFIELTEVQKKQRGLFSKGESSTIQVTRLEQHPPLETLQLHEQNVLKYLTMTSDSITLEQLEGLTRNSEPFRQSQYNRWRSFANYAQLQGERLSMPATYERGISQFLAITALIVAVALTIIALKSASISRSSHFTLIYGIVGGIATFVSLILFIMTLLRPIRSEKEDRMRQEWRGFANMLRDIGQFNMREIASLELWESYLVYAISLGVADKVMAALKFQYSASELDATRRMRHYAINPYLYTNLMNRSVTSTLNAARPMPQFSGNNKGGFGGGFSSGSAGGSGGGSGSSAF